MLTESQQHRLIDRWNEYLAQQRASGDNQYGGASLQVDRLQELAAPPAKALFLGCGEGLEVREALGRGYQAMGVTLGEPDIERAHRVHGLAKDKDIYLCDAHFLPEEWKEQFDAVLAFQTVEHSISGFLFFWEMKRVLRSGGHAYVEVPHQSFTNNSTWHHISSPTPDQMHGWLLKLDFDNIETGLLGEDRSDAARWAFAKGKKK